VKRISPILIAVSCLMLGAAIDASYAQVSNDQPGWTSA